MTEIGLRSPRSRGVLTFGMGVTILCFQDVGQVDSAKIKLNIFVTMGVISNAHSLKNQYVADRSPGMCELPVSVPDEHHTHNSGRVPNPSGKICV